MARTALITFDLLLTYARENDVEFRLLLFGRRVSGTVRRHRGHGHRSGGGNAKLFFHSGDQIDDLEDTHLRNRFQYFVF